MDGTSPALLRLNEVNQVNVALVNVPKTHLVKVVHSVGVGTSPIGETPTQVDGKLLFLHGDGNQEFGPPQPLCLPESMAEKKTMAVMTEVQFYNTITSKGATYTYPLLAKSNGTNSEQTTQMAPIPPYLVYDGFEKDLDTALVLERILNFSTETSNMLTHLHKCLRACLPSHNVGDNKPNVGNNELAAAPSMAAQRWAKYKFSKCFPALTQQTALALTVGNLPQGADLLALITVIKGTSTTTPTNPSPSKTSDK